MNSSSSTRTPPTPRPPSPGPPEPTSSPPPRSSRRTAPGPARVRRCGSPWRRPPVTSSSSWTPICWGAPPGDLVVFLDSDLLGDVAHYVPGLLGPLLADPQVDYVKGCYTRPLEVDGHVQPAGGGRVTELTARPLLNALWPELAGFVQPLGGE